jgi:hypothetical protein
MKVKGYRNLRRAVPGRGQREVRKAMSLQDLREQFDRIDRTYTREEAEALRLSAQLKSQATGRVS